MKRFSLKTLAILLAIAAVASAYLGYAVRHRNQDVLVLAKRNGHLVTVNMSDQQVLDTLGLGDLDHATMPRRAAMHGRATSITFLFAMTEQKLTIQRWNDGEIDAFGVSDIGDVEEWVIWPSHGDGWQLISTDPPRNLGGPRRSRSRANSR